MVNEKRLIDANALIEKIEYTSTDVCADYGDGFCLHGYSTPLLRLMVSETPTADAVEVVRCKDCRHLEITGCYGECKRGYLGIVKPWDFCSYGERKDNG